MKLTREDLGKTYLIEREVTNVKRRIIRNMIDGEEWFRYDGPEKLVESYELKFTYIEIDEIIDEASSHKRHVLYFTDDNLQIHYDFVNDDEWIIKDIKKEIK